MTEPNRDDSPLRRLASFLGIQGAYRAVDGRRKTVDDESLAALVTAFGVPLDHPADATSELMRLTELRARQIVAPALAVRAGDDCEFLVSVPNDVSPQRVRVSVHLEDGSTFGWKLTDLESRGVQGLAPGIQTTRVRLRPSKAELPIGYHYLEVEAGPRSARCLVISSPSRCPEPPRDWVAFMPLYAIRHEQHDWGTGTYTDLDELIIWARSLGGGLAGTLPVLSPYVDDEGIYQGPYLPSSKMAWNEAFLDVGSLPELKSEEQHAASARERIASGPPNRLSPHADIAATLREKRPLLELLAKSVWSGNSLARGQLEEYVDARPYLREYALFSATAERLGRDWRKWAPASARELPHDAAHEDAVRYHLYAQFASERQLSENRFGGLYLDLPVGVHPAGFDSWWAPESFVDSTSGGAPPDGFFSAGQSWGFRPLHPERIREQGYGYVTSYLRHVMNRASVIRLDHVMGLHRMWWVPDGFSADRGSYVRYQSEELRALVVLEAHRSGTLVVGEDLGTVPAEVREAMDRDGMLSSFVFQFESSLKDPLPRPRRSTLASLGTHDLPTFRSYWNGYDVEELRARGEITEPEEALARTERASWRCAVRRALGLEESAGDEVTGDEPFEVRQVLGALLSRLASSPAALLLVDLEDLMLETERQNTPGTASADGNFSRRARMSFEAMTRDSYVSDVLSGLTKARAQPGLEEVE